MTSVPVAPHTWFDSLHGAPSTVEDADPGLFDELAADGLIVSLLVVPVALALLSGALSRMFLIAAAVLPLLYCAVPLLAAQRRGRVVLARTREGRLLHLALRLLPAELLSLAVLAMAFLPVPQVGAALLAFLACGLGAAWGCGATAAEAAVRRRWAQWDERLGDSAR